MDAPERPPGIAALLIAQRVRLSAVALIAAAVALHLGGLFERWGMDEAGGVALVILLAAAVLWVTEAVPLFVTSLLILFLSLVWLGPVLGRGGGAAVSRETWTAPFFSDVILLFLGGFVLAAALHKYRLDEQMARWMVRKSRGELPKLIAGVIAVTAFLSMWLSNTATAAMMITLVLPIVDKLPAGSSPRKALLLSVPFAANVGGLGTPIGTPPNAIAMQYMGAAGGAPTFAAWMSIGIPMAAIILTLIWFLLVFGFKARGRVDGLDCEPLRLKRSAGRKTVLAVALLTALGWMTTSWHGMSSGTVALVPVVLLFGFGLLRVPDLRGLSWDVLLLMGGGLCLGAVLAESGLAAWLIGQLRADRFDPFTLMAIMAVAACAISSLMSSTATSNLVMPMILGLTIEAKDPILLGVAFASSLAMALPISTPPNAVAFSSGELSAKDLLLPGALISAIGVALVLTLGYWWWGVTGVR